VSKHPKQLHVENFLYSRLENILSNLSHVSILRILWNSIIHNRLLRSPSSFIPSQPTPACSIIFPFRHGSWELPLVLRISHQHNAYFPTFSHTFYTPRTSSSLKTWFNIFLNRRKPLENWHRETLSSHVAVLRLSPVGIFPPMFHTSISCTHKTRYTILANCNVLTRNAPHIHFEVAILSRCYP
jgi:hypothetical protein